MALLWLSSSMKTYALHQHLNILLYPGTLGLTPSVRSLPLRYLTTRPHLHGLAVPGRSPPKKSKLTFHSTLLIVFLAYAQGLREEALLLDMTYHHSVARLKESPVVNGDVPVAKANGPPHGCLQV